MHLFVLPKDVRRIVSGQVAGNLPELDAPPRPLPNFEPWSKGREPSGVRSDGPLLKASSVRELFDQYMPNVMEGVVWNPSLAADALAGDFQGK
jgi:hypothetical protein